jgi:tight adherence protein B
MIPLLGALLVAVGVSIAVFARHAANQRRVRDLRAVLELQALGPANPDNAERTSSLLARSGLAAERALGEASVLERLHAVLDRSDWKLSAGEFAVVSAVIAVVSGFVGWLIAGPPFGLPALVVGAVAPYLFVLRSVTKRRVAFEEQFPDVLDLLAASLESGASLAHALQLVVDEAEQPTADEFGRVLTATRVGTPLPEALATLSERLGSNDVEWTVRAITVQQRTGGKLAEILRIVARTMRERGEVVREVRTLTVEGRWSAYILGSLPFAMATLLLAINPHYLSPLFHDPLGIAMLAGTGVLMVIGFVWMRFVIRVEV